MASSTFLTGDGRALGVDEIANLFRETVSTLEPKSGKIQRFAEHQFAITCNFTTYDCDSQRSYHTSKVYSVNTVIRNKSRLIDSVVCITDPQPSADSRTVTSSNGRYIAHLKNEIISGERKQVLAIWDRSKLLRVINIEEDTDHSLINIDSTFGAMSWCPYGEQDKLLYVCQNKRPKVKSFFKQRALSQSADPSDRKHLNLGQLHSRVDNWGECLEEVEHTLIAVLDIAKGFKITTVNVAGHSLADVKWLCDLKTVSVAYNEDPRRLGIIYCNNRPSCLVIHDWSHSMPTETMTLKSPVYSYHTPRVDHSGKNFVYLTNRTYGPHYQAVRMHLFSLDTNQNRLLIDKDVRRSDDKFIEGLASECFSMNDQYIIYVDTDTLEQQLCVFDLTKMKISRIEFPMSGVKLLDFKHDIVLAAGSEINATPTMYVATLHPDNPSELVAWYQMEDSLHLDEIDYKPSRLTTTDTRSFISTILVTPCLGALRKNFGKGSERRSRLVEHHSNLPTVVMLHGGPHASYTKEYVIPFVYYCRLGLKVLLINYRGSSGVNPDYTKSLCGRVGQLDVTDCLQAIRHYISTKQVHPDKLMIMGGSHGGFLACHLSCYREFNFRCAIIRNPVVDLASTYLTTDIPDWAANEALGQVCYDPTWMPNPDELAEMYKRSPMSRSNEAYVPTLMILGTRDKRVKMYQGERWYELLKARGIKTECKIYNDRHALSEADTFIDQHISISLWIMKNL